MRLMENKNQKFKRIASKRVENILKTLDLLSNCSNKYTYEYSKKDVDLIFKTIQARVNSCKSDYIKNLESNKFQL